MNETKGSPLDFRKAAEAKAADIETRLHHIGSAEDIAATFHELHVHQIELEMMNEELRTSQEELEISGQGISTYTTRLLLPT